MLNAPHLAQVESRITPCSILLSREGGSQRETHFHFKLDFQKVDQYTGGKWLITASNTARTISRLAWNSPGENPNRESKHDMFQSIFKGNVQGQKHPGRRAFGQKV